MKANNRTSKTLILIAARMSNIIIAIALSVSLSRVISDKVMYGSLQQLLMIYSMLSVIFAAGVPQSVFYFLPRYREGERKGFLLQNISLLFMQGLLLGLILFSLRGWLGVTFNSPYLSQFLVFFAVYPAFILPSFAVEGALMTYGRVTSFMIFSIFSRALTFLSLAVPVMVGIPLVYAIIIWDISAFILLVISLKLALSLVWNHKTSWNLRMLTEELKYSLPLAGAAFLSSVIVFCDKVVISKILGAAAYAVYANGAIELPLIGAVTGSVQSVLMAEFSMKAKHGLYAEISDVWSRAVFKTSLILLPFWGFLFFWSREFIVLLYSESYEASASIFGIYIWMVPVKIFAFSTILLPLGASLIFTRLTFVNAVMAVLTIPLCAKYFGMQGAAFGAVIIYWCIFFYGISTSAKLIMQKFQSFLPWKKLLILAIGVFVCSGISKLVGGIVISYESTTPEFVALVKLAIGSIIFLLLYLSFLEILGYFSIRQFGRKTLAKFGFLIL